MDEAELVLKCQKGDAESFNILFRNHFNKAVRYAYLITGRKDLAEDIVQEALLECYRDIKYLKQPSRFRAWFYRILVRTSWRVKAKEKNRVSFEDLSESNEMLNGQRDFDSLMESRESNESIYSALNKLSLPLRTTVILHYYNDLSVKEIAQTLNCFQGTVKSRLHNARKMLAKELQKDGFGFEGKGCGSNV